MHDEFHMEHVRWMIGDDPTDQKKDDGHTFLKMMHHPKKIMFLAEHIFFEVPHHAPICVHFYRLNQPATRRM